jgi:hypothetical protein
MRASSFFYLHFGAYPHSASTAAVAALVPVFTDLMANERTGCCAADGAHRAPENRVTGHAANNSAHAGAHLGA